MTYEQVLLEYLEMLDKPGCHNNYDAYAKKLIALAPAHAWELQMRLYAKRIGVTFEQLTGQV